MEDWMMYLVVAIIIVILLCKKGESMNVGYYGWTKPTFCNCPCNHKCPFKNKCPYCQNCPYRRTALRKCPSCNYVW